MREYKDAHGRLMYECFKGEKVYETVERDDGYTPYVGRSVSLVSKVTDDLVREETN